MTGSMDDHAQLAAAIAGALAAVDQAHAYRVRQAQQAPDAAAAAIAAGPRALGTEFSAWSVAGRQMTMGRAIRAYERRRGH